MRFFIVTGTIAVVLAVLAGAVFMGAGPGIGTSAPSTSTFLQSATSTGLQTTVLAPTTETLGTMTTSTSTTTASSASSADTEAPTSTTSTTTVSTATTTLKDTSTSTATVKSTSSSTTTSSSAPQITVDSSPGKGGSGAPPGGQSSTTSTTTATSSGSQDYATITSQQGSTTLRTSAGSITAASVAGPSVGLPAGYSPAFGAWTFVVQGVPEGSTVTVTLTFPYAVPPGASLFKFDCGSNPGLQNATSEVTSINGNTLTMTLTDGGSGDCGSVPGQITDPATLLIPSGDPPQGVPEWSSTPLVVALALVGMILLRGARLSRHGRPPESDRAG